MKIYMLVFSIVFLWTFSLTEDTHGQEVLNKQLTLKISNAKLIDVLREISKQADVKFAFSGYDVSRAKQVSVNVQNGRLGDVLSSIFKPAGLDYTVINKTIIVNPSIPQIIPIKTVSIDITGKVMDEKGDPLPGVNVVIKGTNKGGLTNSEGQFKIAVPDQQSVLVFSFLSYKTQEITVGPQRVLDVKMILGQGALNEVVVVGYGSVQRRDLTGSVGQVNVGDMQKAPVVSFDQALAGRVAGVQLTSLDGQPGSPSSIIIRGSNSITQDNSPLYVIDGIAIESNGNDNYSINPSDIESISVLKDASATAIYGSRGSNGVILITTKRGKAGAGVVAYSSSYGFQKVLKEIPVLSPYEFVKLQLEISPTIGATNYLSADTTLDTYKNIKGIDWASRIFRTALMQTQNLSISGGTAQSKYYMSGSYTSQDGVIINSGYKRYQGRLSLDQTVSSKFRVGVTSNYSIGQSFGTLVSSNGALPTQSYMYNAWAQRPVENVISSVDISEALFDPTVSLTDIYRINPVLRLQNELRQTYSTGFYVNSYGEYDLLRNLKLRVTAGMNRNQGRNVNFNNSKTLSGSPLNPLSVGVNGSDVGSEGVNISNENSLSYSTVFNHSHKINVIALYSQQSNTSRSYGASAIQLPNESLGISGLDEGTASTITATSAAWKLQSFMGRMNYSYNSKYLLTMSMRADGSSKFAQGHQWGYFPSGAIAYTISEEGFMKSLKKTISFAKTRLSYGTTGNNRVGEYAAFARLLFNNVYGGVFGNSSLVPGGVPSGLANAALKWETTTTLDAGLDLNLFNDRISFTGDYYNKVTKDLLLSATLPQLTGYDSALKNIGSVSNSGIELTLSTVNLSPGSKFQWSSSFNISFNRNKVLSLTQGQQVLTSSVAGVYSNPVYVAKVGRPIAQFYGLLFDGLYQYSDFDKLANGTYVLKSGVPSNGTTRSAIQPGYNKFKDLNHDGTITTADETIIGDPNPNFTGGFNNDFSYKGFDLNVFFQFSQGNQVANANRLTFEGGAVNGSYPANTNFYATYANRWTPTNTNTDINARGGAGPNFLSSLYVEDGSYLRLKTISLGYNLPSRLLKAAKITSTRLFVSAQNIYTWTKYSGLDPEVSVRDSALTPGFDYSAYPRAFTVTFGLNVTL